MNEEFTLRREVVETFREGWGVDVTPTWEDVDSDRIAEIDVNVVRIAEDNAQLVGNVWCVPVVENNFAPIANFDDVDDLTVDDSHDLRSRWFATELQARMHAESVVDTWENPAVWQVFVKFE